jgi:hypothetical protein
MHRVALGFRVRSGTAAAIVMAGPASMPTVLDVRRIELSDPAVPASFQPYHSVDDPQCDWEQDDNRIQERIEVVRGVTTRSIGKLLDDCRTKDWLPRHAGIVTGSLTDPATIRSPHVRAHAMEGRLFRTVVEETVRARGMSCLVFGAKTAIREASKSLGLEETAIKGTLAKLGKGTETPWRSEEKLAALAGWVALSVK